MRSAKFLEAWMFVKLVKVESFQQKSYKIDLISSFICQHFIV